MLRRLVCNMDNANKIKQIKILRLIARILVIPYSLLVLLFIFATPMHWFVKTLFIISTLFFIRAAFVNPEKFVQKMTEQKQKQLDKILTTPTPNSNTKTLAELTTPPPKQEIAQPIKQVQPVNNEQEIEEDDFLDNAKQVWKGNKTITFAYKNYGGDKSDRTVDVKVIVVQDNWWYFRGICHSRQEIRTFRADRIIKNRVTDVSTGEQTTFKRIFDLPNRY